MIFVEGWYLPDGEKHFSNYLIKSKNFIFQKSKIIIISTDLNQTTKHLINFKTSKLIKNNPLLVNIARGPIISEKALILLLKKILYRELV